MNTRVPSPTVLSSPAGADEDADVSEGKNMQIDAQSYKMDE